jgi:AraC family transcriptional regulator of adaptative response/methylated-DNA-[protein]-cysteine methyltransferase
MMSREIRAISDAAWNPVANRDRRADGAFVYAAVTTGLYCRPSCPARHPHRRNTLLFHTPEEAEKEGFSPCSRCSPGPNSLTLAEKCVQAVIEHLDAHFSERITLGALAKFTGLCPNHLRETFKRIVGVSPKAFCDANRLARFKQLLRDGETITAATYRAGYESSRAVYEKAGHRMGMTPSAYQHGGEGVTVRYSIADAPLVRHRRLLIARTERGFCAILVADNEELLIGQLRAEFPGAVLIRDKAMSGKWIAAAQSCEPEDPFVAKLPEPSRIQLFEIKMRRELQSTRS